MSSISDEEKYLIGIMSGTSADGINVAIVRESNSQLIDFYELPMPVELREPILRLAQPGLNEIDTMGGLDRALGETFAKVALHAMHESGIAPASIIAIGCHGQTIRHRPKGVEGGRPFTLQIGSAATIAERTGITTISDFRSRDIAAGGEGAPLVPFIHHALFGTPEHPIAVLNIGGIANITYLHHEIATGFDTGPGNMVMDALMLEMSDGRHAYDADGDLAASGNIESKLLNELLGHPYFKRTPPKSTGREIFGRQVVDQILAWPEISDADRMATAAELTAQSIVDSIQFLPQSPESWYLCGGGAYNLHLTSRLQDLLEPGSVKSPAEMNILPEAMEALCFALLAKNTLLGMVNTVPAVTGATHAVVGGQITPGNNWDATTEWIRSHTA
ncbi:MAG TPA: anhydro-N-acetylmuramic acid kinase [Mariprofundaceae bacterium]|nr:anhydro-N-acetylmuramic acid kinase [Mariprofundaceae bacterium]